MKKRHAATVTMAMAILLSVLALGACGTVSSSQPGAGMYSEPPMQSPFPPEASGPVGWINTAPVADLVENSRIPFLFDAELVVRAADVEMIWTGLREAGFELSPAGFRFQQATPDDWRMVANTFDVRTFFTRDGNLPQGAAWLIADSSIGQVRILVDDSNSQSPTILGIVRLVHG